MEVIYGIRSTNTPQDRLSNRVAYLLMWDPQLYGFCPTQQL
jgi:hypothetical protein